jgi:hypothetical protein
MAAPYPRKLYNESLSIFKWIIYREWISVLQPRLSSSTHKNNVAALSSHYSIPHTFLTCSLQKFHQFQNACTVGNTIRLTTPKQ